MVTIVFFFLVFFLIRERFDYLKDNATRFYYKKNCGLQIITQRRCLAIPLEAHAVRGTPLRGDISETLRMIYGTWTSRYLEV